EQTVKRAEHFVDSLNEADMASPGFKESVLPGEVKSPKSIFPKFETPQNKRSAKLLRPSRKETLTRQERFCTHTENRAGSTTRSFCGISKTGQSAIPGSFLAYLNSFC